MESVQTAVAGMSGLVGCILCTACSVAPIVFTVYLGIYSFNNPDNEAWMGVVSGEETLFADKAAAEAASASDIVDIHNRFVIWFLWGFIQILAPIGAALLAGICMLISPALANFIGGLVGCAAGCGGLAWWITGIVWRFRADGAYACGDFIPEGKTEEEWLETITAEGSLFQHQSGKFIAIYYLICWGLMACNCATALIMSIVGCIKGKSD